MVIPRPLVLILGAIFRLLQDAGQLIARFHQVLLVKFELRMEEFAVLGEQPVEGLHGFGERRHVGVGRKKLAALLEHLVGLLASLLEMLVKGGQVAAGLLCFLSNLSALYNTSNQIDLQRGRCPDSFRYRMTPHQQRQPLRVRSW